MRIKKQIWTALILAVALAGTAGCGLREQTGAAETDLNRDSAMIAVETGTTTETVARQLYPQADYMIVDDAITGFLDRKSVV